MATDPVSYIFGGDTGLTYEELKRRRAIAAQLANRQKGLPKTTGEGLTYLGESIGEAIGEWRLRQAEAQQRAREAAITRGSPTTDGGTPRTAAPPPPATPPPPAVKSAATGPSLLDPAPLSVSAPMVPPTLSSGDLDPAPAMPPAALTPPSAPPPAPQAQAADPALAPSSGDVSTVADTLNTFSPPVMAQGADAPLASLPVLAGASDPTPPAGPSGRPLPPPPGDLRTHPYFGAPQAPPAVAAAPPPPPTPDLMTGVSMAAVRPANTAAMPPPAATAAAPGGNGFAYAGKPLPAAWEAAIQRNVPPQYHDYMRQMALKESALREGAVSKTGATGPLQFTRGTGRDYGLVGPEGDRRNDPDASFAAGARLTADNARKIEAITGRPASLSELAIAHQQGAKGFRTLYEGGLPPGRNLAVNNLNPAAGAGGVMAKISDYYGFGGAGSSGTMTASAPAGSRDAVAAAIVRQQQQQTPRDMASDALLAEAAGGRGRAYPATAALGRGDVASDAPVPGTSPLGAVPGMGSSIRARQGIYDAVQQQKLNPLPPINQPPPPPDVPPPAVPTAQEVPPADPTLAGVTPPATSPSLTTTGPQALPDALAQARTPTATDAAPIVPRSVRTTREPPLGGVPITTIPQDAAQGIRPAPANRPPSLDPIPPPAVDKLIDPGPEIKRPDPLGPTKAMSYWAPYINNPNFSPELRAHAERIYGAEKERQKYLQTQIDEDYKNEREKRERLVIEREKQIREMPDRKRKDLIERLSIEEAQHKAAQRPAEADKAKADLDLVLRTLAKPDTFDTGGARLERAPGAPAYTLAPGSPKPKEELTESQSKFLGIFQRAHEAQANLKKFGNGALLAGLQETAAGYVPVGGRYLQSDEYKSTYDHARNFLTVMLRGDSGGVVTNDEYKLYGPIFFPVPGDKAPQIAEKAQRRETFLNGLYSGLGNGKAAADEYLARQQQLKEGTTRERGSGEQKQKQIWRGGKWEDVPSGQ